MHKVTNDFLVVHNKAFQKDWLKRLYMYTFFVHFSLSLMLKYLLVCAQVSELRRCLDGALTSNGWRCDCCCPLVSVAHTTGSHVVRRWNGKRDPSCR